MRNDLNQQALALILIIAAVALISAAVHLALTGANP